MKWIHATSKLWFKNHGERVHANRNKMKSLELLINSGTFPKIQGQFLNGVKIQGQLPVFEDARSQPVYIV